MNKTMKMKRKMKQIISGLLAAVTIFSGAVSPLTASAAETDPKEKKPPVSLLQAGILAFVIPPCPVTFQILQKMFPNIFVLWSDQAKP